MSKRGLGNAGGSEIEKKNREEIDPELNNEIEKIFKKWDDDVARGLQEEQRKIKAAKQKEARARRSQKEQERRKKAREAETDEQREARLAKQRIHSQNSYRKKKGDRASSSADDAGVPAPAPAPAPQKIVKTTRGTNAFLGDGVNILELLGVQSSLARLRPPPSADDLDPEDKEEEKQSDDESESESEDEKPPYLPDEEDLDYFLRMVLSNPVEPEPEPEPPAPVSVEEVKSALSEAPPVPPPPPPPVPVKLEELKVAVLEPRRSMKEEPESSLSAETKPRSRWVAVEGDLKTFPRRMKSFDAMWDEHNKFLEKKKPEAFGDNFALYDHGLCLNQNSVSKVLGAFPEVMSLLSTPEEAARAWNKGDTVFFEFAFDNPLTRTKIAKVFFGTWGLPGGEDYRAEAKFAAAAATAKCGPQVIAAKVIMGKTFHSKNILCTVGQGVAHWFPDGVIYPKSIWPSLIMDRVRRWRGQRPLAVCDTILRLNKNGIAHNHVTPKHIGVSHEDVDSPPIFLIGYKRASSSLNSPDVRLICAGPDDQVVPGLKRWYMYLALVRAKIGIDALSDYLLLETRPDNPQLSESDLAVAREVLLNK